jgi:4-amino-4-deoxy-L-arabinose transferase-like glycosyltransferase
MDQVSSMRGDGDADYHTWFREHRTPDAIFVCMVLGIAAVLRLWGQPDYPKWFADEGTHIDIARHLLAGRIQYLAIQDSTLLFAKPPLFHALLALLMSVAPNVEPMLVLRMLSVALGVCCVLLLFVGVRQLSGRRLGVLAAISLALFPQAVLYSRFGFSYNLLASLVLCAVVGFGRYLVVPSRRCLAAAAVFVGLGTLSDIAGFAFVVPFALGVIAVGRWRSLAWLLPLVFAPFALYAGWLLVHAPSALWFDARFTATRVGGGADTVAQVMTLGRNVRALLTGASWTAFGLLGLVLIRPWKLAFICLGLVLFPLVSFGRVAPLNGLSAYYLIPLLPFLAVGVAAIADRVFSWTRHTVTNWGARPLAATAIGTLIAATVLVSPIRAASTMVMNIRNGAPTAVDRFLMPPQDVRNVAAYVNSHVRPDDLVMASPAVGWLIDARVTEFQLTAAAGGAWTAHLPGNIPSRRFAFAIDLEQTRFVVVDDLWRLWGIHFVPGADRMLRTVEDWPLVFQSGSLSVYRNPAVAPGPYSHGE